MAHPANEPARFERHFPAEVELDPPPAGVGARAAAVGRILWSTSARRGIDAVVAEFAPDIVHLHNIYHHLSPSILGPLARRGIPAVMTLHDYKLACPTLPAARPRPALRGLPGRPLPPRRRPPLQPGLAGQQHGQRVRVVRRTRFKAYDKIRLLIGPSRFLVDKMAQARVFPDRLRHLENFVDAPAPPRAKQAGLVVFAGRLSPEKGIDTLIGSMATLPDARLAIAGEGIERGRLEALADAVAPARVRFLGRLDKGAVDELLAEAAAVAVPSRWYENQPMVVLEALAAGTAVVGTAMGGLPEVIEPGRTGALVAPDDPEALAGALRPFVSDIDLAARTGADARTAACVRFSTTRHLAGLDALYDEARS